MSNKAPSPVKVNDVLDHWYTVLKSKLLSLVTEFLEDPLLRVIREDRPVNVQEFYARAKLHVCERLLFECTEWTAANYGILRRKLSASAFDRNACRNCDDDCSKCNLAFEPTGD